MQYCSAGNMDFSISRIAFGTWRNFNGIQTNNDSLHKIVSLAMDKGITFFDTADVYANGEVEQHLGKLLSIYPRDKLVIATKVGKPMHEDFDHSGLSRSHIFESIHASLQRLKTDYVDIYYCHLFDPATPLIDTISAMNDLIQQGKIRAWGTSKWTASQIQEAFRLCQENHLIPPCSEQLQYSLLFRNRLEKEILPATRNLELGFVAWSPLAMGMLTGKYRGPLPANTRFAELSWARNRYLTEENQTKVTQLQAIASELNLTLAQLAIAWVLHQPEICSCILGARNAQQLAENCAAVNIALDSAALSAIDLIFSTSPSLLATSTESADDENH